MRNIDETSPAFQFQAPVLTLGYYKGFFWQIWN